jgi:hypothetical protein
MDYLFVHIHKAGGSTIKEILFRKLQVPNLRSLAEVHIRKKWRGTRRHEIPDDVFAKAFKFCFVRNPWDRVVSAYTYTQCRWPGFFYLTFKEYIYEILRDESIPWDVPHLYQDPKSNLHDLMMWDAKGHAIPYRHPGYFMEEMDFIGRFENLEHDFQVVLRRMGRTWGKPLLHKNASARKPYPTYYTPQLRNAVGALYHDDIVRFGYTFDEDHDWPTPNQRSTARKHPRLRAGVGQEGRRRVASGGR